MISTCPTHLTLMVYDSLWPTIQSHLLYRSQTMKWAWCPAVPARQFMCVVIRSRAGSFNSRKWKEVVVKVNPPLARGGGVRPPPAPHPLAGFLNNLKTRAAIDAKLTVPYSVANWHLETKFQRNLSRILRENCILVTSCHAIWVRRRPTFKDFWNEGF